MPTKSKKKFDDTFDGMEPDELVDSMILGVTNDSECVYIHTFEDDITALEFLETMVAGFRSDVLSNLLRRFSN